MSPRAARAAALPFALLIFALRLLDTFWIMPMTFRRDGFPIWAGSLAAVVLLPWSGYLLLTRRARVRPAAFEVAGGVFVVPAIPARYGTSAMVLGLVAGSSIITERVPGADRMRLVALSPISVAGLALALIGLILIAVTSLERRPMLVLAPDAMTVQRRRAVRIGWDQLVPGGPAAPRGPDGLTLYTWDAGSFRSRRVPIRDFHVDPAFLAHAIRTYAAESAHRPAIGTAAELARLRETFTAGPGQSSR
jgi:hypothetical protein